MTTLTLRQGSRDIGPRALCTGRDLVIEPTGTQGATLPPGTALDDYLEPPERADVDHEARRLLEDWRGRHREGLTIDGIDLTDIWEVELLAQCFMPAAMLEQALPVALRAAGADALALEGLGPGIADWASAIAEREGIAVHPTAGQAGRTPIPSRGAVGRMTESGARVARVLGVPARVRGSVICVPYWHLAPLYGALAAPHSGLRPVAPSVLLPGLGTRAALDTAIRGGWLGVPGGVARRRSGARIGPILQIALREEPHDALHTWALSLLAQNATSTLANVDHARRALGHGRARLIVLPWDSPEYARMLIRAARDNDVATLVVQHGFDARLGDPDKSVADRVAVWSARDAADLVERGRAAESITLTGNPGASHLAGPRAPSSAARRTAILVEYPGRLSALVDSRVSLRHTEVALRATATARPGTTAIVRPHPSDPNPAAYASLAESIGGNLVVVVDTSTPIEPLLATCDICVGALSTATLQAAALGVPTVFLDVTTAPRPFPFDGGVGGLPRATSEGELAELIGQMAESRGVAGAAAAREALGATASALVNVRRLVASLAA